MDSFCYEPEYKNDYNRQFRFKAATLRGAILYDRFHPLTKEQAHFGGIFPLSPEEFFLAHRIGLSTEDLVPR